MSEDEVRICPLCGGRVFWMPVSLLWVCEHCKNTFNRYTAFPEPKKVEPIGDAAKLREALRFLIENESKLFEADLSNGELELLHQIVGKARAALSAPPRNCDVGTVEEQIKRQYDTMCNTAKACPDSDWSCKKCFAKWSRMPYEEGGAK